MCSYSTVLVSELAASKLKINYRLFVHRVLVDRLSFFSVLVNLIDRLCLNLGGFLVDSLVLVDRLLLLL